MGTKNQPGEFDCYSNADDDEPMFILLARDPIASTLVRDWAGARVRTGRNKTEGENRKIREALQCADAMDEYRKQKEVATSA